MVHLRVAVLNIMLSFILKVNSTKGSIEIRNAGDSGSVHLTGNHLSFFQSISCLF